MGLVKEIKVKTTVVVEVTARVGVTKDDLQLPMRGQTSSGEEIPLDVRARGEAFHIGLELRKILEAHDWDDQAAAEAADGDVNAQQLRYLQQVYAEERPDPEVEIDDQDARALEREARKVVGP